VLLPGFLLLSSLLMGTRPFFFGWAKPVPIDPRWFRRGRLDWILVALAGPGTNFVLATLSAIAYGWLVRAGGTGATDVFLRALAAQSVVINCVLAVFNLLPVPPLDGGRILAALLPAAGARALRQVEGMGLILVVLLVTSTGILSTLVRPVIGACEQLAQRVAG
jgi:Zn-dependent protease